MKFVKVYEDEGIGAYLYPEGHEHIKLYFWWEDMRPSEVCEELKRAFEEGYKLALNSINKIETG